MSLTEKTEFPFFDFPIFLYYTAIAPCHLLEDIPTGAGPLYTQSTNAILDSGPPKHNPGASFFDDCEHLQVEIDLRRVDL